MTTTAESVRWSIAQSVGPDEANQSSDVRQVQSLLNMIGMSFGGTFEFPLATGGTWSAQLGSAIETFQTKSMNPLLLPADERGKVSANSRTLQRLNELAGCFGVGQEPDMHPIRRQILKVAQTEIGIVSDRAPAGREELDKYNQTFGTTHAFDPNRSYRKGATRLRQYFTGTVNPELQWTRMGKFTNTRFNTDPGDDIDYDITTEEGILYWNKRPPLGVTKTPYAGDEQGRGFYNGFHWCGVFAVWVMQQVGMMAARWDQKLRGINGIKMKEYSPSSHQPGSLPYTDIDYYAQQKLLSGAISLRPGDIVVILGGQNHHLIVTDYKLDSYVTLKGQFRAIAGNGEYQEVNYEKHDLSKIYRIYHAWPE